MAYKFSDYDALCIGKLIQKRRPEWSWNGIMKTLEQAAMSGATLGQVTAAADMATQNKKATSPGAILWEEHINASEPVNPQRIHTTRVCGECTRKKPIGEMTRNLQGIWVCGECGGASSSGEGA